MVFSTLEFLFFFLPVVVIVYAIIPAKISNLWLLLASLTFYYLGDHWHMKLLMGTIMVTYVSGLIINHLASISLKKITLAFSVATLILTMSYYKYFNFMIDNINLIFHKEIPARAIAFPVGISFFIFQAISYIVDVYRGEKPLKNPIDLALYISFFPQLIAGPIVRFKDINKFMSPEHRALKMDNLANGTWRFATGLCKKVLLANNLGIIADTVYGVHDISTYSALYTWLGAIAYTLQIYLDFSGYSDMAIGLGKIFGFEFQENFNFPYTATSVKDFWRRWHISLSQFFRDYVYIPLGGNRCGKIRWVINLLIVWFLTGMWHGASWNFIAWGLIYGFLLIAERLIENLRSRRHSTLQPSKTIQSFFAHIYTLLIVNFLWVLFRANDFTQAKLYLKNMFCLNHNTLIDHGFTYLFGNYIVLLLLSCIACVPVANYINEKIKDTKTYNIATTVLLTLCTLASISFIYMGSYNPFLYFIF